jgi:hypothetical protein
MSEEQESTHFVRMLERIQGKKLELTDTEWMNIIVRDRDGLPPCCANISSLRDVLIHMAREDGLVDLLSAPSLARSLTWCFPDHDVPSPEVEKIITQLGWESYNGHEKDVREHG